MRGKLFVGAWNASSGLVMEVDIIVACTWLVDRHIEMQGVDEDRRCAAR